VAMATPYFTKRTFDFLSALALNNRREWFEEHKQDYEVTVRLPALHFIGDMTEALLMISPHFQAMPKKVGGSLMRVQRDIRFGKDKRPYKTNIGIQFRHEIGKDVHAPAYYVHIEPNDCFVGVGVWRPDASALGKIRDALVENSDAWLAARDDRSFNQQFSLAGDTLSNPPRGYAKDHPLMPDLKRKDFIALTPLSDAVVRSKSFYPKIVERFGEATPYMRFLCKALDLRF